jgi:hypothetical protein
VKNFFAVKDIQGARQRLDRLIQEEIATTASQILGRIDGLERKITDGKRTYVARNLPSIEYLLPSRQQSIN